jgi:hypothetical protein
MHGLFNDFCMCFIELVLICGINNMYNIARIFFLNERKYLLISVQSNSYQGSVVYMGTTLDLE